MMARAAVSSRASVRLISSASLPADAVWRAYDPRMSVLHLGPRELDAPDGLRFPKSAPKIISPGSGKTAPAKLAVTRLSIARLSICRQTDARRAEQDERAGMS